MEIFPPKKVKIAKVPNKGRGVIATEKILKGETIEYCPLIIMGKKDAKFVEDKSESDVLYHYCLEQSEPNRSCIILGYGSLYNHSSNPNAELDYTDDPREEHVILRAMRDIEAGEEITWDYDFDDKDYNFNNSIVE